MKPALSTSTSRYLPLIILLLIVSGVYLRTLAPGLTWANGGSDGGDLITAAYTGGVAHPTGYPLYLLLARLFQWIPVGSLAYRTNLLSALTTILAVLLIYKLLTRLLFDSGIKHIWLAGMVAGLAFGLAPLVWSQAVITEVYALQTCLVLLILYLYVRPLHDVSASNRGRFDVWRGLVLGLAMGNHVTTFLIVPIALLVGAIQQKNSLNDISQIRYNWLEIWRLDGNSICKQLIGFGIGLSIYLIIPLRGLAHSPVNWGKPVTPENFWWLVSGQLYQSYYLQTDLLELYGRIQSLAGLLIRQLGIPGITLGLLGLIVFRMPSRLYMLTVWTAVVSTVFALFYGSDDSYVYLIPMIISFAIWIGVGTGNLIVQLGHQSNRIQVGIGLLFVSYFLIHSMPAFKRVDASHDLRAEIFGREVLDNAPENALIFAKGDRAVFTLWYFHFALKERTDLVVIAEDLLHFDWYQGVIKQTYPYINVPGPFPWPETIALSNPAHSVCYVQYVDQSEINCRKPRALLKTDAKDSIRGKSK